MPAPTTPTTEPDAEGGLAARLAAIEWRSETVGFLDGAAYHFEPAYGMEARDGAIFVFKPRGFLDHYARVLDGAPTARVLELGMFRGGSVLFLASFLDVERLVGVDICEPLEELEQHRARHPKGAVVRPYYGVSQDDEARLGEIVDAEFPDGLDLVIDDASHLYAQSRRSFEILFPRLRPGGWYVYEDWGWAHHRAFKERAGEPSAAGFVFELQLAWLTSPEAIANIVLTREAVFVRKSEAAPLERRALSLDALIELHGRSAPLVK